MAALLVGSAGGFLVGKAGSSSAEAADNEASRADGLKRAELRSSDGAAGRSRAGSVDEAMREASQMARLQTLMDLYAGMSAAELEAAAGDLDNLPMGDRIMASMLLFSQWGEVDPQGALEFTKTMGFGGMFARPTVLRSWASVDPVNAAQYYKDNPNDFDRMGGRGPRGDNGAGVVALEWAKQDPQAALDWAQTLDGRDKSAALASVLGEMAVTDPAEAASVAAGLDEDDRNRAYSEIAEKWAQSDLAAAESWAKTLTGEDQQDAMAALIGVMAKDDPQGAAAKIEGMSEGRERERAIRDVASSWAREAPAEAAEWVVGQGDGEDGLERVIATWAGQDSAAALSFIQEQPEGEMRDAATQTYLRTDRSLEPEASISLAESISDERDRSRTVARTAMRWMRDDETAARTYVEQTSSISDDLKERLLSGDGDGGGFRRR
ncbi:MAG: hypothetical protein AAGI48_00450 [Verrucomicrobiota bacterium]